MAASLSLSGLRVPPVDAVALEARAAVCAAIAAGERELRAVAVVTGLKAPARPCGACRQVLAEFAPARGDLAVLLAGAGKAVARTTIARLLPDRFTFADVAKGRG